jgi:hypothetical protein
MECICRFGSYCDLHQKGFPGRRLCYRCDIAFAVVIVVLLQTLLVAK